ncbi:hypothetical protein [Haloarchaeobius sp. HRN-SO-5]|uniref:Nmad3 family putative nucleotide modification protein n=1 Tax=Haloarchaeobius sp. HRN-SO-5 TaxID=3446118 RepID=UPI003EB7B67C
MTVVCCGVGADTTNVAMRDTRVPRVEDDGRFEYVPIPEKTRETDERRPYGDRPLRYGDGTMADVIASLVPDPGGDAGAVTDPGAIASYPPHHDPNFEALTYGEHRPGYVARLADLDPGDAVAFYAGLEDGDGRLHRYLVGWFRVDRLTVVEPDDDAATKRAKLARHPENAHTKRAVDGVPYRDDRRLVLLDGDEGGLFDRVGRPMSTFSAFDGDRRAYFLDDEFVRRFSVVRPAHDPDSDRRADKAGVTRKPAVVCDLDAEQFRRRAAEW